MNLMMRTKDHSRLPLRVLALLLASALSALAFNPALNLIGPRGGQRGTEVKVTLYGSRLYHPEELLFYKPGITVKELKKVDEEHKRVEAILIIAPDAELGEHPMRLRCQGGVTYMRTFWVGQFPSVREKTKRNKKNKKNYDLNDRFDAPQVIPLNSTVNGVIKAEDVDYYRVTCKKGQRLSVEIEAMRLGRVMFDPYIAILNASRFELSSSDDSPLLRRDAACSLTVPEDGEYTILVRESSYRGSEQSQYRLHVGDFPRPTAIYPPGALPGKETLFTFIGDPNEPELKASLTLPSEAGRHPAFAVSGARLSPSALTVRVSPTAFVNEVEPNDLSKEANPKEPPAVPIAFHGILSKKSDKDWFRFHAKKGQRLRAQVFARSLRSPVDSVIIVRDPEGKQIGQNDDSSQGAPDSKLDFKIEKEGDYFINIRDQLYRSGPDFTYRIEITPRTATIAASLPYGKRNDSQLHKMICIPQGARVARKVTLTRQNTRCDLALSAPQLPAGVTLHSDPVPGSLTEVLAVFEASPDAPITGGLYPLGIKDPKSELTGSFRETIHHLEVNNAGTFHTTRTDRHCIAVIEKAPFSLDLEIPPVPVVRNGLTRITVLVKRDEGYTGKIKVSLPWKPPGIGAPTSIDIAGDKSEGFIDLNANSEAPLREWRICVQASAETPQGTVLMASPLRTLKVAEPYLGLTIELAATQPGKNVDILCQLTQRHPFSDSAKVTLQGLPHGVTAPELTITAEQKEIVFPLTVTGETRVGKHGNVFAQVIVIENGHPIRHSVGAGGVVRVDPLPKEPAKAQPAKAQPAEKPAPKPKPKKPLSRLEQLRQEGK
jgi:hypothetical protein